MADSMRTPDMFMKVSGIDGECDDEKHKGWIEIYSWDCQYNSPGLPPMGGDETKISRARHSPFKVTKRLDKASAELKKHCWKGKEIDTVNIECFRSVDEDTNISAYLKLEFKGVRVHEYSLKSSSGELPEEELELLYSEIEFTYVPIDKKQGMLGAKTVAGHNLVTNVVK